MSIGNKSKKTFLMFMALCLIFVSIAACASENGSNETPGETTVSETTAQAAGDTGHMHQIAESDYACEEFMILYIDWSLISDYYFSDEANGDAVNDAIFDRTARIEEHLNIDINSYTLGNTDTPQFNEIKKNVYAGDDVYDLALIHNSSDITKYVSDGVVKNWNDIPQIDMTKSYWNESVQRNMEVEGVLAFASNDFILPDVNSIFFNKLLIENLTLEDPYTLVNDGEWTWEQLIKMAESASADINGDGIFDENDQYGFVGEYGWQLASVVTGCGQYTIQTDDGQPQIVLNTEKMVSIIDMADTLLNEGNTSFTWPFSQATDPNMGGTPPVSFDSGRALFYYVPLSLAPVFRATEVEFGILPMPKFDRSQTDYISLNWAGFMCVPASADNTELVGKTVELLGYWNGQLVIPAFYDILLGQKISRDTESQEMLDILFGNTVYDLGVNLGSEFYMVLPWTLDAGGNFASYYEKKIKTLEKIVEDYNKAHIEFEEAGA
jgi:hypothetical protein